MKTKEKKIEVWFDKMSQTLFLFGDDEESHSFLKDGGTKKINEMVEKVKNDVKSTDDDLPDYIRFLKDDDGWTIEGYFDENVGCDEDGRPSIVDFMNNVGEMEIPLTDRGTLN